MREKQLDLLNFKHWRRVRGNVSMKALSFSVPPNGYYYFSHLSSLILEPKDPPKNVIISVIPEEVNRVQVTFTPPEEPNGNITAYFVYIYEKGQLVKNISLNNFQKENNTVTAVIGGLKGGQNYTIQVMNTRISTTQGLTAIRVFAHVKLYFPILHLSVCRFQQGMELVEAHSANISKYLQE